MSDGVRCQVEKVTLENNPFIDPAKKLIRNQLQALKIEYYNNVPPKLNATWKAKKVVIDALREVKINLEAGDSEGFINAWGNFKFVVSEFDIVNAFFSESLSEKVNTLFKELKQSVEKSTLLREVAADTLRLVSCCSDQTSGAREKENLIDTCEDVLKNRQEKDTQVLIEGLKKIKPNFPKQSWVTEFFAKNKTQKNSLFVQAVDNLLDAHENFLNYVKEINMNPDQNSPKRASVYSFK